MSVREEDPAERHPTAHEDQPARAGHHHAWQTDPEHGLPWQRCSHLGCGEIRHRPLRDGGPVGHPDALVCPATGRAHRWHPVSFAFETQHLDDRGRVLIRRPDTDEGRLYAVCLGCHSHTYMPTAYIGYRLHGPFEELLEGLEELRPPRRRGRAGSWWRTRLSTWRR